MSASPSSTPGFGFGIGRRCFARNDASRPTTIRPHLLIPHVCAFAARPPTSTVGGEAASGRSLHEGGPLVWCGEDLNSAGSGERDDLARRRPRRGTRLGPRRRPQAERRTCVCNVRASTRPNDPCSGPPASPRSPGWRRGSCGRSAGHSAASGARASPPSKRRMRGASHCIMGLTPFSTPSRGTASREHRSTELRQPSRTWSSTAECTVRAGPGSPLPVPAAPWASD
jgi:hypothetical protein